MTQLEDRGVTVRHLAEDLVTREQIAERANVTTQAVGLWARRERHTHNPFPAPYTVVGSSLWLWADVNTWLATQGKDDGMEHPQRVDYLRINTWLTSRRDVRPAGESLRTSSATRVRRVTTPQPSRSPQPQ